MTTKLQLLQSMDCNTLKSLQEKKSITFYWMQIELWKVKKYSGNVCSLSQLFFCLCFVWKKTEYLCWVCFYLVFCMHFVCFCLLSKEWNWPASQRCIQPIILSGFGKFCYRTNFQFWPKPNGWFWSYNNLEIHIYFLYNRTWISFFLSKL